VLTHASRQPLPWLIFNVRQKMSRDYVIPKGTGLRFFPERSVDPVLRAYVEEIFARHECLKAYSVMAVKRGWLFSRKISTLCVVYEGAEAYQSANAELANKLGAYFTRKQSFMDCISFDWSNAEHRGFIEALMVKIPFTMKKPNQSPEPTPTAVTPPAAQEPRQP
jgi:hypothetical protein